MSLFGLLPYNDEEERRRRMVLPGISPNKPPILPRPISRPLEPRDMPRGPLPGADPSALPDDAPRLSRPEALAQAKHTYMADTPGRGKSAILNALRGFVGGMATGGGLGAGLGGALAGGAYGAIDPRGARAARFEMEERPRVLERFALEDVDEERQRRQAAGALDAEYKQAQIDKLRQPAPLPRPRPPVRSDRGLYDPDAGRIIPGTEPLPKPQPPTAAEQTIDPDDDLSVEEKADASYQGKGGDQYVLKTLPARTRQILTDGTVTEEGAVDAEGNIIPGKTTRQADADEIEAAQQAWDRAIARQRKVDLDYTRGHIRSKVLRGRKGQPAKSSAATPLRSKPQRGRTAISVQEAEDLLR
jgi:hypothetical protein